MDDVADVVDVVGDSAVRPSSTQSVAAAVLPFATLATLDFMNAFMSFHEFSRPQLH